MTRAIPLLRDADRPSRTGQHAGAAAFVTSLLEYKAGYNLPANERRVAPLGEVRFEFVPKIVAVLSHSICFDPVKDEGDLVMWRSREMWPGIHLGRCHIRTGVPSTPAWTHKRMEAYCERSRSVDTSAHQLFSKNGFAVSY